MPQRLKSRSHQIPNGMYFREPSISWDSRKVLPMHPSFDTLVRAVISARKANPHYITKNKWSLDFDTVANEVETFQVKVCLAGGWTKYLTEAGGGAPPFSRSQSLANQKQLGVAVGKVRKLWVGIKTISEWIDSNAPAVSAELSESRAQCCLKCPFNSTESLTEWFATPAVGAIKRQLEKISERNLRTSVDDRLGICAQKSTEGDVFLGRPPSLPLILEACFFAMDLERPPRLPIRLRYFLTAFNEYKPNRLRCSSSFLLISPSMKDEVSP